MNLRNITNFDYLLFFSAVGLTVIGILFIYSSGVNSTGVLISGEYAKQIIWAVTGILLLFMVTLYDYNKMHEYIVLVFIFFVLLLIYTLFFGKSVKGAKSWIGIGSFGIQVSEFTKIVYILFTAHFLSQTQNQNGFKRFAAAFCIMCMPMGLILLQPDLGTASVYLPVFLIMCFIARIALRYIFAVFAISGGTLFFMLLPLWEKTIAGYAGIGVAVLGNKDLLIIIILSITAAMIISLLGYLLVQKKYFYWIAYSLEIIGISLGAALVGTRVLKEYQLKRLIIFLDPEVDPLGAGWNIIQSMTAIGAGGKTGVGFLQGTQSHYRFLPEQSTDFIFSILSEEWGFAGGIIVFGLYGVLFARILDVVKNTDDMFGKLIAAGVAGMLFFHFTVNIGMVMGFMPITGIPLFFLSYGGSSLWTAMISLGLVIGINFRKV